MPTDPFSEDEEFFKHQIRTTLDVSCSPWLDWFHGGLNFQIPHHIWPRIARPNLRRVHEHLVEFCKKHDIKYTVVNLTECITMILRTLKDVADQVDVSIDFEDKKS